MLKPILSCIHYFVVLDAVIGRYHYIDRRMVEADAAEACEAEFGGYLADIYNEFELGLVNEYLQVTIV